MVFQDPFTSLHPMLSVGQQLTEHMRLHLGLDRRSADKRAVELLEDVRIPGPRGGAAARIPHQFSGGMRQRIAIAIALACRPQLLIADEPTTALDVTVQAGILRLLDRLRHEHDLAVVLITHDLGVLSSIADTVLDLLRRPRRRVRRARRRAAVAAASLHAGAARRAPASRGGEGEAARRDRRRAAGPGAHPAGLCVQSALRVRDRLVQRPTCRRSSPVGSRRLACPVDPLRTA